MYAVPFSHVPFGIKWLGQLYQIDVRLGHIGNTEVQGCRNGLKLRRCQGEPPSAAMAPRCCGTP